MKKALILVDIQNDYFKGGAFPLPRMQRAAKNASSVLNFARKSGWTIVHVQHNEIDQSAGFLVKKTNGAKINSIVAPKPDEHVVVKNFPNSFHDTNLSKLLKATKQVVIVGAMSNMCIDSTARAAFDLGYSVTVVEDGCAASSLEFRGKSLPASVVHASFMAALASGYAEVTTAAKLIRGE